MDDKYLEIIKKVEDYLEHLSKYTPSADIDLLRGYIKELLDELL